MIKIAITKGRIQKQVTNLLENANYDVEPILNLGRELQIKTKDDLQIIFRIPWGHNKIILDKCKGNSAKALFYIRKTIENNWSRDVLLNFLGTDLYERQGKAITNFSNTLPIEQSDLAQAITKDPYNFDFLTLRERYDEKELKDALIEKVNNFLMELGTGFANAS